MVQGMSSVLLSLCMAHRCFNSAFNLSGAPEAHWDAYWRGSSHCNSWYQNQLVLTVCHVRYHIALWDNRSIGQL